MSSCDHVVQTPKSTVENKAKNSANSAADCLSRTASPFCTTAEPVADVCAEVGADCVVMKLVPEGRKPGVNPDGNGGPSLAVAVVAWTESVVGTLVRDCLEDPVLDAVSGVVVVVLMMEVGDDAAEREV
jgi:hypothetical protein